MNLTVARTSSSPWLATTSVRGPLAGRDPHQDVVAGAGSGWPGSHSALGGRAPGRRSWPPRRWRGAPLGDHVQREVAAPRHDRAEVEAHAAAAGDRDAAQPGRRRARPRPSVDGHVGDGRAGVGVDQLDDRVAAGAGADAGEPLVGTAGAGHGGGLPGPEACADQAGGQLALAGTVSGPVPRSTRVTVPKATAPRPHRSPSSPGPCARRPFSAVVRRGRGGTGSGGGADDRGAGEGGAGGGSGRSTAGLLRPDEQHREHGDDRDQHRQDRGGVEATRAGAGRTAAAGCGVASSPAPPLGGGGAQHRDDHERQRLEHQQGDPQPAARAVDGVGGRAAGRPARRGWSGPRRWPGPARRWRPARRRRRRRPARAARRTRCRGRPAVDDRRRGPRDEGCTSRVKPVVLGRQVRGSRPRRA